MCTGSSLHIELLFFQSDVWALGCCVYEMSTLKHAFNARDMNSLVYRIVEGKVGFTFLNRTYSVLFYFLPMPEV